MSSLRVPSSVPVQVQDIPRRVLHCFSGFWKQCQKFRWRSGHIRFRQLVIAIGSRFQTTELLHHILPIYPLAFLPGYVSISIIGVIQDRALYYAYSRTWLGDKPQLPYRSRLKAISLFSIVLVLNFCFPRFPTDVTLPASVPIQKDQIWEPSILYCLLISIWLLVNLFANDTHIPSVRLSSILIFFDLNCD